jgi:hypothetical protein
MEVDGNNPRGRSPYRLLMWGIVFLLAVHALYKIPTGAWLIWSEDRDWDLQARSREYALFRAGWYPFAPLDPVPSGVRAEYTVYPPYAFPMMAPLFEPGGLAQARVAITALSLASLAFLAACAARTLRPYGWEVAAVGAVAAFTISGNKAAFLLGQFSILCTALVFLQMILLGRGRPYAAGACWALAMLKPHVALAFAPLFLLGRGRIRGLLVGLALLGALSWFACAWTGVGVTAMLQVWLHEMDFSFSGRGVRISPGPLATSLGIDHRLLLGAVLGSGLAGVVAAAFWLRRLGPNAMLPLAGLCSVVGMLGVYHWMYDQIMLFPAVLATLALAGASRRPFAIAVAAAMLCSLLPPMRYVEKKVLPESILAAIWVLAAIYPLVSLWLDARRTRAVAA